MRPNPTKKRSGLAVLLLVLVLAAALVAVCVLAFSSDGCASVSAVPPSADAEIQQDAPDASDTDTSDTDTSDVPETDGGEEPSEEPTSAPVSGEPLTCYVIDVGQGDSILLVSPNGKTMLIDAGDADHYDAVMGQLSALSVTYLDVLVATHPHVDHIGAMGRLVKNIGVGTCYMTDQVANIFAYTRLLDALDAYGVPTVITDSHTALSWDTDCDVTVLSPVAGVTYEDLNTSSIVLKIDYGNTSLLLMGDATIESEAIMLQTFPKDTFAADVLKLGHHGSSDATSERFLRAVDPALTAASLGRGNEYGHPHRETLALLREYGLPLYRTDELGTVKIVLDGINATVVE